MLNGPLPADTSLAWGVVVAAVLIAFAPLLLARVKKPDPVTPPSATPISAAQPQLDAGNALLATAFANLEKRTSAAEERADEYARENAELRERLGKAESELVTLRHEVQVLVARLMERGTRG